MTQVTETINLDCRRISVMKHISDKVGVYVCVVCVLVCMNDTGHRDHYSGLLQIQ